MRSRSASLLLLLPLFGAPRAVAAAHPTDAFVVAGQSNAAGWSTQFENQSTARVTSPNPQGLASWSFRGYDHRWVLANEFPCADSECTGTSCQDRTVATHPREIDTGGGTCLCHCGIHQPVELVDAGRGSAWPTFAARWMQERGHEVRLIATAVGAQCLVGSPTPAQPAWNPDAMDCATLPPPPPNGIRPPNAQPGELYCRMLEAVRLANTPNLRAVLWYQGECDATAQVDPAVYRAALEHLADRVWSDLGVPMIVAPISRRTAMGNACPYSPRIDGMHDAIVAAINAHPKLWQGPDTDDLPHEPDCSHIHDVQTLGVRWYEAVAATLPTCGDGLDNDRDGRIDFPLDADCPSATSNGERGGACDDGVDNDGDGVIDYPVDPGCARRGDASEHSGARCDDGLDDDGDGDVDYPDDPGCTSQASIEATRCDDGLDNDGDGKVDWDGGPARAPADPQCVSHPERDSESAKGCGLGAELAAALGLLRLAAARAGAAAGRSARRGRTRPRAGSPTG
jgi:Carbohydrate esterase, sialic acid-specific acetylesterase